MSDAGQWTEFLIRASSTAFVVVFIAWIAARLGPAIGGVVIGLPIVLAPGFFFMLRDHPAEFVSASASGAIFSLAATQIFLGAFVAASTRIGAIGATACAIAAWCVLAIPLAFVPHDPLAGTALFALATFLARLIGRRFVDPEKRTPSPTRWSLLMLRGIAAGVLVGCVTFGASRLGPSLAGTLLAFPIGFCVILLSLRLDHGAAIAGQTAYAGLVGVVGLAGFCLALALASRLVAPWPAFGAALLASVAITTVLTVIAQSRRN
jgi:hypothetical protein